MKKYEFFMKYNHYRWLENYFNVFCENIGFDEDLRGLIPAHGDKCSGYRYIWKANNIPFDHGVAIYLLTYINPFRYLVRETKNRWIAPEKWIIENYKCFEPFLPESWTSKLKGD